MLKIRLQRVGKKNQASFRIVLAEKHRAVKKQVNEILGYYNPCTKDFGVKDPERVKYWISQHVEISPTVNNLLIDKGLLTGEKVKAWKPKKKKEVPPSPQPSTTADKSPTRGEGAKVEKTETPAPAEEKKVEAVAPAQETQETKQAT